MEESEGYYLDLSTFPLDRLKSRLRGIHLSRKQQVLVEDMDNRFDILQAHGISNLLQLQATLKNKRTVTAFAEESRLPVEFLTVLRRWVNGYEPKRVPIADFPPANPAAVAALAKIGIHDTLQLFPRVKTLQARASLSSETGISKDEILLLTKLTDLVRLKWVGPKFAHLLLLSGFDTVEKVASADGFALHRHLKQVNEEAGVFRGGFSEDDINLWIQFIVCDVPISIKYDDEEK